jgi:LEA14-like dessication related protein
LIISLLPEIDRRKEYARFLLTFLFLGFMMKVVSEFIHELGHATFVLILGGKVTGMSISVEWPFTMSYTTWEMKNSSNFQIGVISIGGILFDVMTTVLGQALLISRKKMNQFSTLALFWLSFWPYLGSVVYLVMGAFYPFGDILALTNVMETPRLWIGALGIMLLITCTYSLSMILREIFSRVLQTTKASEMVSYFWALLHLFFVSITIVKVGLPLPPSIVMAVLALIFVWSYITARWLVGAVSRLRGTAVRQDWPRLSKKRTSDLTAEQESRSRKMRIGYVALISVALISTLLTGYMLNQYIATYSLVMKTEIDIEVTGFDLCQGEPALNLSVKIMNPNRNDLMLRKIEFDVHLNQKYMDHQVLGQIPVVQPNSEASFDHILLLPVDRMFTIEDAQEQWKWEWTVTGAGYVETLFGDTLLRFETTKTLPPTG